MAGLNKKAVVKTQLVNETETEQIKEESLNFR
jgi:hypothetical protein